ncbi:DinB family protein [Kibdelosporangium philippinense]|uniref:DinB family protein n=1 Tax=Kibdelosporangium philippinense TaxID=211113 RepID=A0ABS8ZXF8_9PSEU|nr:DinB family protein [Kibdelosporangium philippinense]MCE7011845.1 DinB family protein [Kibdelosporangium philippinense]
MRDLLRWQFDLTWSLLELHLAELTADDFRWQPAAHTWAVRDGVPDWADTEPDPIPVPTIAWVTWHIGWWWSVTLDHASGRTPRDRTAIGWPGDGDPAVKWLRDLRAEWIEVLADIDLTAPAPFPWQDDPAMTVAHMAGWVNSELMKNVAEIGQLRLLRGA